MWRDRTNLYISYRQSYSHHPAKKPRFGGPSSNGFTDNGGIDEERRGLMSAGAFEDDGDAVIEMDILPPRWLDIQDEVTENLTNIARQTRRLEQLHQKHVLPGFDDEDVKRREEREIEQLTQEITRGFQSCQKAIKRIETMVRESQQQGTISKSEVTMAINLKISLATRVGEVSSLFRKKQSTYLKKLKSLGGLGTPQPTSRTGTPFQNPYTDPSLAESEADRSLGQSTLLQTTQKRATTNDTMIAQREREIEDIAQGIIELANIFQDLQAMVIDQGSMLDRIDYNVERMAVDIKGADKELIVATGYQKRSVKRKIMLLLIIVIAGVFILLSLKLSSKGSSSTTPTQLPPSQVDDASLIPRNTIASYRVDLGTGCRKAWQRRKRRSRSHDMKYSEQF
ncbi:putative syntaxin family protein [Pseudovirgaria hyperparasitica]|uniref:Putative syntaxin family protein n=1 Tax=Pseudovirgaria hyperparasitica TaxID=470096 RepID=A0A6A6WMF7_9PEZI|nr:putative syntaxin family protein [Pseudovirgaria hyperparasitica]KAF2763400.1 putative syntaxin family protein [Pseudovirgaria hyperparasitica]